MSSLVTNLDSSTAQETGSADGCVHTADATRDSTRQLRRVGVGSVYWALGFSRSADRMALFPIGSNTVKQLLLLLNNREHVILGGR